MVIIAVVDVMVKSRILKMESMCIAVKIDFKILRKPVIQQDEMVMNVIGRMDMEISIAMTFHRQLVIQLVTQQLPAKTRHHH